MIITVKATINSLSHDITAFQQQYNTVIRWAYNRSMEGLSRTEVFNLIRDGKPNNTTLLDTTWKREAAKVAQAMAESDIKQNTTSVFYRRAFYRRLNGKTTHEEFIQEKQQALYPIRCEGSKADNCGNRKFKFNPSTLSGSVRLGDDVVIFTCNSIGEKRQRQLIRYIEMAKAGLVGITYSIKSTNFYILIDQKDIEREGYRAIEGRTLALDMNPNYIGLSVVDSDDTILCKTVFNMSKLSRRRNKNRHELTQVAIKIARLCRYYHISLVGFERLKMPASDKGKGKAFNRMVNNDWNRDWFVTSLKKHLELCCCPYREVAPEYSSFVGCMCYPNDVDSVAASIELNRRLRLFNMIYIVKSEAKRGIIFPEVEPCVLNRWKEEACIGDDVSDWKSLYDAYKRTRHSYRRLYGQWAKTAPVKECRLNKAVHSGVVFVIQPCNELLCFR